MVVSKFVGYFLEQVSNWQQKLSTADSVITIWFEVQRTWSHLESIFIGSEDIRAQLPQHSKQFDTIDADFKVCSGGPCRNSRGHFYHIFRGNIRMCCLCVISVCVITIGNRTNVTKIVIDYVSMCTVLKLCLDKNSREFTVALIMQSHNGQYL